MGPTSGPPPGLFKSEGRVRQEATHILYDEIVSRSPLFKYQMLTLMEDLKNWCPGRSVLAETNPWPLILTQACRNTAVSDAIASAIGCLAGMYIYDYLADERIREAVCRRYTMAAEYYQELLKDLKSKRPGEGEESVALGVVLSTIHVQQRHGKPGSPSWLEGYKQCKSFLHQTNPGGPFWENVAVQRSHLRDALSVIVGRGLIFSQLLAPLPDADLLNLPEQATEFKWLLFGNERETLEIDGGYNPAVEPWAYIPGDGQSKSADRMD
ncbi:hypothetical protein LRP88_14893 [Fusarium phalaenopsidis]